jgi:sigma-B regulation protein RsbU (phosphoserine phosphatase)
MKILIAEDDALFRRLLQQVLAAEHEIVLAEDGGQAWAMLQQADHPLLALLDWVMPVMSGPQICRKVREDPQLAAMYLILLTAKNSTADVVSGLRAGADDYVTKPFIPEELRARVRIAERLLHLEFNAQVQAAELRQAQAREARLQKLLPICPSCRKIRSDRLYWQEVEEYLREYEAHATENSACTCPRELDRPEPEPSTEPADAHL